MSKVNTTPAMAMADLEKIPIEMTPSDTAIEHQVSQVCTTTMAMQMQLVLLLHALHEYPAAESDDRPPPRRNNQSDEELYGKLKYTMPKFKGDDYPEEYLKWALKVDKIFRVNNFSEAKKVAMASFEFEEYANV